jgi:GntR family transcriptional regulator, transcriptional repressor for pyruvate dehydrogenase complex
MAARTALAAVFEPLQTATTFEETVERLGTAIRLGILPAGLRLPSERDLAEQLGISRSTLRLAITTLVESGHLSSVRGRTGGTFVADAPPLSGEVAGPLREDWREVLDLRVAVEIGAVTLAAERMDAETLRTMRDAVARMAAATEFPEYSRADVRFHIAVAQASGVPRLVALITEVLGDVTDLIAHIAHPEPVLRHANEDHARLIEALAGRDGDGAVRVMRRHLEGTGHILAGLMPGAAR